VCSYSIFGAIDHPYDRIVKVNGSLTRGIELFMGKDKLVRVDCSVGTIFIDCRDIYIYSCSVLLFSHFYFSNKFFITFMYLLLSLTVLVVCELIVTVFAVIGITVEVNVTMALCLRTSMWHLQNQCAMP
jgi:hypothetical protein